MRSTFLALAILALLAIPAAAHADTITIAINGGQSNTYTVGSTPDEYLDGEFIGFQTDVAGTVLVFYNPAFWNDFGYGSYNFNLGQYSFTGSLLYSGEGSEAVLNLGIYELGPMTVFGATDTATLVIDADTPPAVTPEPSSLALFGTGILGVFGAARRRFNA